jgi:hypothetical protein
MIVAGLIHAHLAAYTGNVPGEAIVALGLLGRPEVALRQVIDDPIPVRAAQTLRDLVDALERRQALTARLIDLARSCAEALRNNVAQARAFIGLAEVLTPRHPDLASGFIRQALSLVDEIQYVGDRADVVAALAAAEFAFDSEHAYRLLDEATRLVGLVPDNERAGKWAGIAVATAAADVDRALESVATTGNARFEALAGIARVVAPHDPSRAVGLAHQLTAGEPRPFRFDTGRALAQIASALAGVDPVLANEVAGQIVVAATRAWGMAMIAQAVAPDNPELARAVAVRAIELAEDRPAVLAAAAAAMAGVDATTAQKVLDQALELAERKNPYFIDGPGSLVSAVLACAPQELDRVGDGWLSGSRLDKVAQRVAASNIEQAKRLVERAAERAERDAATVRPEWLAQPLGHLARVGAAMIPLDSSRADHLLSLALAEVDKLPADMRRDEEVGEIAGWLAGIDWPRALPFLGRETRRLLKAARSTRSRPLGYAGAYALSEVARAMAHHNPVRAVMLSLYAPRGFERVRALTNVAGVIIKTDRVWGRRLLHAAADEAQRAKGNNDRSLQNAGEAIVTTDPARAMALAQQVSDGRIQAELFANLATTMAAEDLEQAVAISEHIPDWARQFRIGGTVAMIDYLQRPGTTALRLGAALRRVLWDLDATFTFVAMWLEKTWPTATPAAESTGRAIIDTLSRFSVFHSQTEDDGAALAMDDADNPTS